ncbi:MAG: DNA replication/repair protein RecF [Acidimicrobiales bacterium]|nr:DNA replication/repair protein RecF [Acidimicrobiales bacterium]
MRLTHVWLTDFRSHEAASVELSDGLTAIIGPNGSGKTNLLEAIGVLSRLKSFRGASTERLIRHGAERAFVRAEGVRDDRPVLIEIELAPGRSTVLVNKQRLNKNRDLLGALRVTVFAPDDLALIKDGPAVRRDFLDELMVALDPRNDLLLTDLSRTLKQRNTLLKQAKGRLDEAADLTLEVYDSQLATLGMRVTYLREHVLAALMPRVGRAYELLAGTEVSVVATYRRSWEPDDLADAIADARTTDLARAATSVGPHRDEIALRIDGFDSRSEASQGEQRTLALALRFAGHELVTEHVGEAPLLLLDDVLSELDPGRATALLSNLPEGQTVITSATDLPELVRPDVVLRFPLSVTDLAPQSTVVENGVEKGRDDVGNSENPSSEGPMLTTDPAIDG